MKFKFLIVPVLILTISLKMNAENKKKEVTLQLPKQSDHPYPGSGTIKLAPAKPNNYDSSGKPIGSMGMKPPFIDPNLVNKKNLDGGPNNDTKRSNGQKMEDSKTYGVKAESNLAQQTGEVDSKNSKAKKINSKGPGPSRPIRIEGTEVNNKEQEEKEKAEILKQFGKKEATKP